MGSDCRVSAEQLVWGVGACCPARDPCWPPDLHSVLWGAGLMLQPRQNQPGPGVGDRRWGTHSPKGHVPSAMLLVAVKGPPVCVPVLVHQTPVS